ncbi:hypothetical protein SO802_014858 [Lithocarpus litseifolius]|uniref:Uncharacterized protein n=1 Tax=Lithocarpus litseifolius TaxID=425828 RepID=A0AAW2CSQ9_9ROSI
MDLVVIRMPINPVLLLHHLSPLTQVSCLHNACQYHVEFINAIEIVPIVVKFFADSISTVGDNSVNLSGRGIQTMYRLNVGGTIQSAGNGPVRSLDFD